MPVGKKTTGILYSKNTLKKQMIISAVELTIFQKTLESNKNR